MKRIAIALFLILTIVPSMQAALSCPVVHSLDDVPAALDLVEAQLEETLVSRGLDSLTPEEQRQLAIIALKNTLPDAQGTIEEYERLEASVSDSPLAHLIQIKTPQQYSTKEWSTLSTREKADAVFRMLDITPDEEWYDAIEHAHEHRSNEGALGQRADDGTYPESTYSNRIIAEKSAILEAAGIPHEVRLALLKYGVTGEILRPISIYQGDEIIIEIEKLNLDLSKIELTEKWWQEGNGKNKLRVATILTKMHQLLTSDLSDPQTLLILEINGLDGFLIMLQQNLIENEDVGQTLMRLMKKQNIREIHLEIDQIRNKLMEWKHLAEQKVSIIENDNAHLQDLPIHNKGDRFYVKVNELNPYNTLFRKHPLEASQYKRMLDRDTEELIKFSDADPISGYRSYRAEDSTLYPGSKLNVQNGHHRLNELYRRYLKGELDGETLIEFQISYS